jgi:protein O-mannosyl-transferase
MSAPKDAVSSRHVVSSRPLRESDWPTLVCGTVLSVAAIAAYARTFSVPPLFDDDASIAGNPTIRHFVSAFWPPAERTVSGRPVLNLSLAVNYAISGTQVWSYHALNLAIHVAAGLILFGIIRRTLESRGAIQPTAIGFIAALLWAVHPLLTESVTYVVQRAESLMGLFYLLTLYCVIRGAAASGSSRNLWYAFSVAACFLGMGTKEVMVSAPLIVLLYDCTFLAGNFRVAWRLRGWVYGAMAATWLFLLFLVLGSNGRGGTAGFGSGISWQDYGLTQLPAIAHYLRLAFWPHPLVFDYGVSVVSQFSQFALGAAVVSGLIAATLWALFRKPALGFLGAWFFAILLPSSSIVPVATETMAEHRMYLSLIAVVVLVVVGAHRWLGRAVIPIGAALATGLFFATWERNEDYQSHERIWADAVEKLPGNERAHSNLGDVLDAEGRPDEAMVQRIEALRLKPDSATVHNNVGTTLARIPGRLNEAVSQFEEALRLKPNYAEAENNLGNALAAEGRTDEALDHLQRALRLKPDSASAHNNLGIALAQIPGRLEGAIAEYEEALRLNPDYAVAHNNLGSAWARVPGRLDEAISQFEDAVRLNPGFVTAHGNLGNALAKIPGRRNEAIAQYEEALRLRPDIAGLHVNLAIMLLDIPGRSDEAVAHLKAALRLQPGNEAAEQILSRIGKGAP